MTTDRNSVEVEPEVCYVGIVPRPPGRINHRIASFAVEGQLPRPLEDLCVAWRAIGDRLVVVAVDREQAESWLADGIQSAVLTETPSEGELDVPPIELLSGTFLPASIRRHRGGRLVSVVAMLAVVCAVVSLGLHQRTRTLGMQADAANERTMSVARSVLPDLRLGVSPELALTGELRRLRSMATGDREDSPPDSRTALAALLASWPEDAGFRVESSESAGGRVDIRAIAPSRQDAIQLSEVLAQNTALDVDLPRVRTETQRTGEVTRVELAVSEKAANP